MHAVLLFCIWRVVDWCIALISPYVLPYSGHFSHPDTILRFGLPHAIRSFANFDGVFYIRIAQQGYAQYEHAFFPLYPALIKLIAPLLGGNHLVAGLLLSNLAFCAGLVLFSRYLSTRLRPNEHTAIPWTIAALLLFPSSFFLGALYTEGLFFLFLTASFYFLAQKRYTPVFFASLLAASTRFIGVFLIVPILLNTWPDKKRSASALGPIIGLGLYMAFLYTTVGDPLAFFHAQPAFGAGRSTQLVLLPQVLYRYLKMLLTVPVSFPFFVAALELSVFLAVVCVVGYQLYRLSKGTGLEHREIVVFSLINIVLPTVTGTLLSIPRFALMSLSFFLFIGTMRSSVLRIGILTLLALGHFLMVLYFMQGYFVS